MDIRIAKATSLFIQLRHGKIKRCPRLQTPARGSETTRATFPVTRNRDTQRPGLCDLLFRSVPPAHVPREPLQQGLAANRGPGSTE